MATLTAPSPASSAPRAAASGPAPAERYLSLDAYRGLIMILLVSSGFGIRFLTGPFWAPIAAQFDHVKWEGVRFWDLVQPAFLFMAGVAMPFALARRIEHGASFASNLGHVLVRAIKLILIAQMFTVVQTSQVRFGLLNVLDQMAFCYVICFLLMQLSVRWQVVGSALLLAGHTALFHLFPGPQGPFSMTGNIGNLIDLAVLGRVYEGNYASINFITSAVNMMFGVWVGYIMMSRREMLAKIRLVAGIAAIAIATGLALSPFIPLVKRIRTASFNLYSTGLVMLLMLPFVWLVEIKGLKNLAFPLVVVGMNSIFVYVVSQLIKRSIYRSIGVLAGNFAWLGIYAPVAQWCATIAVVWYACYWLYRRKVFFKV
jgi:heparan-alpha-glucosaminide N-acetyltransferase